ncbi:MAG: helix-turn-helix transcriptional regulator [Oscillospiraceae bacterium]|nr:helix-turn-helix transcriptional regulator [Oscillospiraceae bacterium]
MPREKFRTLTEQMFYVLLCLKEECYGMDILDKVPAMTGGRVTVGSGTLYNLLEEFTQVGMIEETKVEGRKRSYILTRWGRQKLREEYERIEAQGEDYRRLFREEAGK